MKIIKVRINKDFAGYKQGDILNLTADINGVPTDIYWRNRFKDAEIDNCCEVVKKRPIKSNKGDE